MSLCLSFWFCGIQLKRCRLGKLPNTTHHETGSAGEVKNLNAAPKPSSFYFLSWNFIPLGHNFIILKYAYMVKFTEIVSHSHTPGITKGNYQREFPWRRECNPLQSSLFVVQPRTSHCSPLCSLCVLCCTGGRIPIHPASFAAIGHRCIAKAKNVWGQLETFCLLPTVAKNIFIGFLLLTLTP